MSYTTIYKLWPYERYEHFKDLENAWGSAPLVWSKMFLEFIGAEEGDEYPESAYTVRSKELWPLYKRMDIDERLRAVLTITYDQAYIAKEHYARAAADIRYFLEYFEFKPVLSNHWYTIAHVLASNPDCPAIGFHWNAVTDNPFEGIWDEDTDSPGPTRWNEFWEVYRVLNSIKVSADYKLKLRKRNEQRRRFDR